MTIARSRRIDMSVTRWYHCVTRCVRRAFLLGDGTSDRKEWIENRIEELAEIFALGVGGFSVIGRRKLDSPREGMFEGLSLGSYLLLVDYTGRFFRSGKAAISATVAGIFDRLGSRAENWQTQMEKLRKGRLFGRFFAASRDKLQEVAEHLDLPYVRNLAGCPTR
jgi:hypothetical protein